MKFKVGDIVRSKQLGTIGIVCVDPVDPDTLIVRIHPFIYGKLIDEDWELYEI